MRRTCSYPTERDSSYFKPATPAHQSPSCPSLANLRYHSGGLTPGAARPAAGRPSPHPPQARPMPPHLKHSPSRLGRCEGTPPGVPLHRRRRLPSACRLRHPTAHEGPPRLLQTRAALRHRLLSFSIAAGAPHCPPAVRQCPAARGSLTLPAWSPGGGRHPHGPPTRWAASPARCCPPLVQPTHLDAHGRARARRAPHPGPPEPPRPWESGFSPIRVACRAP